MYDYRDDYSNAVMDDLEWWTTHKPFIEKQFDFIHGHFFYSKYAELFPDAEFLVCLRNPVDRIISQFNHVWFEANPDDWQYRAMDDDGLDIVEYAKLDGVHDAQARHIEGRDIKDYEFVFLSETLRRDFGGFQVKYTFARADPYMLGTVSQRCAAQPQRAHREGRGHDSREGGDLCDRGRGRRGLPTRRRTG